MTHVEHFLVCASSAAILATSQAGCLCPPCPAAGAAGATATTQGAAPAATPAAAAAATPAGPTPDRLVIWDGDKVGAGQSWADCTKKDQKCKSVLSKSSGAGANGSSGLKWHGEGPDWMGAGWNWMGWYPPNSGTDISAYSNLTFQVKVEFKAPDLAPDADAISVRLVCSNGKNCGTATVPIHKYVADYADGKWHKVVIPFSDLVVGEGAAFDKKSAWEFGFSEWAGAPRDFTVYVDDIAVEK